MDGSRKIIGAFAALALAWGVAACSSSGSDQGSGTDTTTAEGAASPAAARENLRNQRYCEILPFVRDRLTIRAGVYNTVGYNDCPPELWDALTEEEVNEAYGSMSAELNGPRYIVFDSSLASGSSADGDVFTFGGIEVERRATIEVSLLGDRPGKNPYAPNEVERYTVFTFDAGKPIFELTSPDGDVYVMQSYTTLVDPTLAIGDLEKLGNRLDLPEGWTYSTRVLDQRMDLDSGGLAYVIQDDLLNSYQRRT